MAQQKMEMKEYQHRLAQRNLAEADAVLFEPRVLYDVFTFDGSTEYVFANPAIFRNGERWPIRITHIMAQMLYEADDAQSPVGGDERLVQRYGMRIKAHGTYYMNSEHVPLPLWHNQPAAASDVATLSQTTWKLNQPFIMGNRDTVQVEASLIVATSSETTQRISVALEGVGRYTRTPKRFVATRSFTDADGTNAVTLDIDSFRNDGTEPFEIHKITVNHVPDTGTADPTGTIRGVRIRMRNNGNGTGSWWIAGAPALANDRVPAPLFGTETTRAIVHRLPGKGWLWYPNEGVRPELRSFVPSREESVVIALVGHLMVY